MTPLPLAYSRLLWEASCLARGARVLPGVGQLAWDTMLRAVLARGSRVSGGRRSGDLVRGPANPALRARAPPLRDR